MKTILITGASSGIGRAVAEKFSADNKIILCARNRDIIEGMAGKFPDALAFTVDVRNQDEIERTFLSLEREGVIPDVVEMVTEPLDMEYLLAELK